MTVTPLEWVLGVTDRLKFWYNTTYHSSTGMTPFQALYGRLPPSIPLYFDGLSRVHEVDQSLLHRDELLQHLKKNLDMTTNRMKQMADQKKKRDVEFQAVNLELPPITDEGVASVELEKILDTRWIKQGEKFIEERLVKWKRLPTEDATW
ncbi:hypothetical protein CK203_049702 [Vitis vinifera]|uniref:Chromo domain-containing protein n=1 Tax=Vitis vinifera TaxID=29760 RepID=A0A438H0N8_VITVI|nr:hypothetical protein CK203_049702 [Vitis vinifera]